ncbi:unnamed protein product [Eruca vesicaria subsp. sativa]|uniref:Uncharacterized protein n=1 Tax=Eruca vesicaria subsp. sativa TaxID=29727 RepID=A0ABC8KJG6_ERUVS|nr:unnamed protein product [Eruca vesicaria subsp. sativa]
MSLAVDIGVWITIALKCRYVRDLSIKIDCSSSTVPVILQRSLYTKSSRMLVSLKLKSVTLMDGSSTSPSFLALKTSATQDAYFVGTVFHRLVHLRMCTCETVVESTYVFAKRFT